VVLQKPSIDVRFLKEKGIFLSERHALFAKGTVAEVLKNSSDCFISCKTPISTIYLQMKRNF